METHSNASETTTERDPTRGRALREAAELVRYREARLSRMLDHLASSLEKEPPLEASLGAFNAGLMRMALRLEELIVAAMESGPLDMERFQEIKPAIETHLRLLRQMDRFANIELRAAEADPPPLANDGPAALGSDARSAIDNDQSEESDV
jgi:hypothetical protein